MKLNRDTIWSASVVLAAMVFAWLGTMPSAIALINWDNAGYIADIASGGYDWSHMPWSSHLGIGQEYLLGVWLAQALGGTVVDGFRIVNAVAFALACWVLFDTSQRLSGSRWQALALVGLWATAWVNFHYHLILEDNFLFLAPCAALLRICVLRVGQWRPRDSLLCGMFCLLAVLGSYQALPYIFAAGYTALLGPGRSLRQRLRDATLVLGGVVGTLLLWMAVIVATSRLTWKALGGAVLMGPVPNYLPRSPVLLLKYIFDGRSLLETLGNGVFWNLSFHAYKIPFAPPLGLWTLGLVAALFLLAVFIVATRWSWRTRDFGPHIMAATLLLLSFATSVHKDEVEYTGLKRYDFFPLLFVFLAAALLGELRQRAAARVYSVVALALALVAIPTQLALGLRWTVLEQRRYHTTASWNRFPHPEPMRYGREGKSWFHYFRDLNRAHRDACTLVFSYGEIADSTWNYEVTGALYSEVRSHLVLVDDAMLARFRPAQRRVVPRLVHAKQADIPACAWVSEPARELLASAR